MGNEESAHQPRLISLRPTRIRLATLSNSNSAAAGPPPSAAACSIGAAESGAYAPPKSRALVGTPDELRARLAALLGLDPIGEVASLLDVSQESLYWYLYSKGAPRYRTFPVRKRRGGVRVLSEPLGGLKQLQRKLLQILSAIHPPRSGVHGFSSGRSVRSNAEVHTGARVLLNVDLQDFFPSIHFGRVHGILQARPYNVPRNVAAVLAQLCCHRGILPQGAPTSPILANMVAAQLDSELRRLAARYRLRYSRYADDITFSTRRTGLPSALVRDPDASGRHVQLGDEVLEIIARNGFHVNLSKVRVARRTGRMEVTGVIVNERPNLPRSYIRQLRGMLHAWEAYGADAAADYFATRYDTKDRRGRPHGELPDFRAVVRGKLDYLKMIRGADDNLYAKLAGWYADLASDYASYDFEGGSELAHGVQRALEAVWVVETLEDEEPSQMSQGTGFVLRGVGLVTCAHVVTSDIMTAYRPDSPTIRYALTVQHIDVARDLAVLRFRPFDALPRIPLGCVNVSGDLPATHAPVGGTLRLSHVQVLGQGRGLHLCGFPNYSGGSASVHPATVVGFRQHFGHLRITVDGGIYTGMSGGPAIDKSGRAIGVIATGDGPERETGSSGAYGIIPASVIRSWRKEWQAMGESENPE